MKNFLTFLFASIMLMMLVSCDSYAQMEFYDNGIVHEYSYNAYPVRYVGGVAYYYTFYNDVWTWLLLPRTCYPMIVHHRPIRYSRPIHRHYNHRQIAQPHRTISGHGYRIPTRPGGNISNRTYNHAGNRGIGGARNNPQGGRMR